MVIYLEVSTSNIIITESDYSRYKQHRKMLFNLLKLEFATSPILYIGYSNRDLNWKKTLIEIEDEFFPSSLPTSYRVSPKTDAIDIELLKAKNIETIDASLESFVRIGRASISIEHENQDKLRNLRSDIPLDLIPAFDENPVPTLRLISSWTYVNQAQFDKKPNVREFLRGDRPNWSLIGSRQHFERDLEEEIYNEVLDFATSSSKSPKVSLILGPAGYGTTTLMMSIAAKLIKERAGSVFMLNPGSLCLEGDIDFAASTLHDKLFFFVDDASDHASTLRIIIHRLKEMKKPAMFILGERLNEWRQTHIKIIGKEFEIEPLSDPEIYRLIDCLAGHCELNALEPLSLEIQFAAIKRNFNKELLVAMREATEGKSFDAILEDEFRGIKDPLSRQLYLTVCCFYQHGSYVRDTLLAQLLNVNLTQMYNITRDSTEGVVIYDCINSKKGFYAARARHRIIATVVWERCGENSEQEAIIQKTLSALNLNYNIDKVAFEHFIRSDRMVDCIRSLEGRMNFFEKACQKDPRSPYVRQHYSRMLSRADKAELALDQIEKALGFDHNLRILYHTKGIVLMQLALNVESLDIARRRLVQSEDSFRKGLSLSPRDEYCYLGLSQLFFGWARRSPSLEESVEYVSKAEEVINEGLKKVRVRDSLWIESSKIQAFIGNEPSRLKALEKAIEANPASIIARYLLGRAYRKAGYYQKAIDILYPIILNHHNQFRSFVEYSVSLIYLKNNYKEAIATLSLSRLYGLSDPRFIATFGGMLFMDNNFSEAERIFLESSKHNFTATELNKPQYQPPDPKNPATYLRLRGRVIKVKAGHAIIESPGYPAFLCPGSKFGQILMMNDLRITFEPAFAARGPLAIHPKLAE